MNHSTVTIHLNMGNKCYHDVSSLLLSDLPELHTVSFGMGAFRYVHSVVFENLPKLQSIQLGIWTLNGDRRNDRKTISYKPYNFKNTLTMRNLPSLTEFKGSRDNFKYIGSVILENIPKLPSDVIRFYHKSFKYTYSLRSFNAPGLESFIKSESNYV